MAINSVTFDRGVGEFDKDTKKDGVVQGSDSVYAISDHDQCAEDDSFSTRNATVFSSTVNLVNTIVGAGVLALPSGFAQCGWLLSSLLMVLSAGLSFFGLHLLSKCCHRIGGENTSFGLVVHRTFPKLSLVADIAVTSLTFGVATSYLIVVGDVMPDVIGFLANLPADSILLDRRLWITIGWVVFGIPLGVLSNVNGLRFTSLAAIVSIFYIMILVVIYCIAPEGVPALDPCSSWPTLEECHGTVVAVQQGFGVIRAMPIYIFSFCCHANIFQTYNELKKPSVKRMDMVSVSALSVVSVLYIVFGLCGYFTYGSKVSSNILLDYPQVAPVTVARILITFVVLVSYPLLTFPTRQSIIHFVNSILNASGKREMIGTDSRKQRMMYWAVTGVVLGGTYALAMFVDNLGIIFGVIGATSSSLVTYVFPGLCFFFMFRQETDLEQGGRTAIKRWAALALAIAGLCFMPVALVTLFV